MSGERRGFGSDAIETLVTPWTKTLGVVAAPVHLEPHAAPLPRRDDERVDALPLGLGDGLAVRVPVREPLAAAAAGDAGDLVVHVVEVGQVGGVPPDHDTGVDAYRDALRQFDPYAGDGSGRLLPYTGAGGAWEPGVTTARCARGERGTAEIRGALLSGVDHVDFLLRKRQRVRASFDGSCPALDFYGGFYLKTDDERVFGIPNATPYVKDGVERAVLRGDLTALAPDGVGTKAAAHYNLGNARLAMGDASGAVQAYKQVLRAAPGNQEAKYNLEIALREESSEAFIDTLRSMIDESRTTSPSAFASSCCTGARLFHTSTLKVSSPMVLFSCRPGV